MPSEKYLELLRGWASDPTTRFLAIDALRGRCPSDKFYPVASGLVRGGVSREEESELLSAARLHGGFTGPLSVHYRERERYFARWEQDPIFPLCADSAHERGGCSRRTQ